MIAYRASDVKLSWDHRGDYDENNWPRTCGYVKEEIENEYQLGRDELEREQEEEEEEEVEEDYLNSTSSRKKRQADQYEYTPTKTRCPLLLVADYRFYQEMGASNTKTTINYLVNGKKFKKEFSLKS